MSTSAVTTAGPHAPRQSAAAVALRSAEESNSILGFQPFGADGLTFDDVLDVVNPLQHVPLLSVLYREITGDGIDAVPRIAGGAIFGGWMGAAASLFNVIVEEVTDDDLGGHAVGLVKDVLGLDGDGSTTATAATQAPTWPTPRSPERTALVAPADAEYDRPLETALEDAAADPQPKEEEPERAARIAQAKRRQDAWFAEIALSAMAGYEKPKGPPMQLPRVDIRT